MLFNKSDIIFMFTFKNRVLDNKVDFYHTDTHVCLRNAQRQIQQKKTEMPEFRSVQELSAAQRTAPSGLYPKVQVFNGFRSESRSFWVQMSLLLEAEK